MKRVISWIILLGLTILVAGSLFISGKQHKVFVKNGKRGMKNLPKVIEYSIDGADFKKLRATKMGAVNVKGRNHELTIRFKDENNEEKTLVREFKARLKEVEAIDFIKIIENEEDWLEFRRAKKKNKKKD